MNRLRRVRASRDEGAALVMALTFLVIVALFAMAALDKSSTTVVSGQQIRLRGDLQYALDGGVDRALQVLKDELSDGAPASCVDPDDADGVGNVTLNGQTATYTCKTLAGRAAVTDDAADTNYALVTTSPNVGALTTQAGISEDLLVGGSVFLNGKVTNANVGKPIKMTDGDLVSPASRANCDADLTALTNIQLTAAGGGQLRACTEQTLADALPTFTMPTKPSFTVPGILAAGLQIILGGGAKCRVFYPGTYTAVPPLPNGEHAYFVSGVYYFEFPNSSSTWTIDGDTLITAGQRGVTTDTAVPVSNCSTMTDATALAQATALPYVASMTSTLAYGTTWIVGGSSKIDFKKGQATLFTPYQTPAEEDETPMNFIAVESNGAGYKGVSLNQPVITGGSNNTLMQLNAKLYAPTAAVDVFSTNSTVAAAKGGVVAYTIALKASAAGSDALAISARPGKGKPRPPFRTVKIVSKDGAGGGSASNTAVATISNYPPYSVTVKSWRTGTD